MSASYTLHVAPFATPGDPQALDRADLVRDGFSWGAFLVPALWFLRHRHWWLALGAVAVVAGVWAGLTALGAGLGTILGAEILIHLLMGLEGPSLRRWSYGLRNRPTVDVVSAASEAEAEAKTFARWLGPAEPAATRRPPPLRPSAREADPVIGLFPDSERRT